MLGPLEAGITRHPANGSRAVETRSPSDQGPSLVVDLAARTVAVDGERVDLPPDEFDLLATLATRPGVVIPSRELRQQVWADNAVMTTDNLRWRIWNLRKKLGDRHREHMIIGNRRGVGYLVDLPRDAVRVIPASASDAHEDATDVIVLDPPRESEEVAAESEAVGVARQPADVSETVVPPSQERRLRRQPLIRPHVVVMGALAASILLAGSWATAYWLSQRTFPSTPTRQPRQLAPDRSTDDKRPDSKRSQRKERDRGRESNLGGGATANEESTVASAGSNQQPTTASTSKTSREQNTVPSPQPDAQLFHLVDPDSGDHYMTTSSSAANQKQAQGYEVSIEGLVFSERAEGALRISLDAGAAYVYRHATSAPDQLNVAPLYRLSNEDDSFYTSSSSVANQAQAQGWSRSKAGYVAT
jgi:DNA-binding winged helix-turn-helix (wHTH) protein